MRGIQVTTGSDIPYAADDDFVLNTEFLGGLKIQDKVFFKISRDFTFDSSGFYYHVHPHGLGYVPAVLCFTDGNLGTSWQNGAIPTAAANADAKNVYLSTSPNTLDDEFCLLIFGERVADS